MTLANRFWLKVNKSNTCWEWTASTRNGYGQIGFGRNILYAHRISWKLHYGEIPHESHVLHKCDNKLCVRPDHLFLGSNNDNIADSIAKGRHVKGESCGSSKLTAEQIQLIRSRRNIRQLDLAKLFNVSQPTISDIQNRKLWKHLH